MARSDAGVKWLIAIIVVSAAVVIVEVEPSPWAGGLSKRAQSIRCQNH